MKVEILPNYFLNNDGTYNLQEALMLSGKIAGVCYDKEGFKHLENEPVEKTNRRINMTLGGGHHSVYDHQYISFNIENIPKMLAMVINNEHEYTTSEKSARYTPVVKGEGSIITATEEKLYNKWNTIFFYQIKEKYGNVFPDNKIKKLAQENARYLVTVFMPTKMIYTTSLRQINYLAGWMQDFINNAKGEFNTKLADYMEQFINELRRLNVLDERLMQNEKHRVLSLFEQHYFDKKEYYGDVYLTKYNASFAELAQAQRHRTIDYSMTRMSNQSYFVPPILEEESLRKAWLEDIHSVGFVHPQGEKIKICESGSYDDFILKCKERLCSAAQLEIMQQTRATLLKYQEELQKQNHYLADDIARYTHGARCTFPDFECTQTCDFKEGKTLVRKI